MERTSAVQEAETSSTFAIIARILQDVGYSIGCLPIVQSKPSSANWIRIRLLCGTSALNSCMSRITRGTRNAQCSMCGAEEETVEHFLAQCAHPVVQRARTTMERMMTSLDLSQLRLMDPLGYCGFILGGPINGVSPNGEEEDAIQTFIHTAWSTRKEVQFGGGGLRDGERADPALAVPARPFRGVAAHGHMAMLRD